MLGSPELHSLLLCRSSKKECRIKRFPVVLNRQLHEDCTNYGCRCGSSSCIFPSWIRTGREIWGSAYKDALDTCCTRTKTIWRVDLIEYPQRQSWYKEIWSMKERKKRQSRNVCVREEEVGKRIGWLTGIGNSGITEYSTGMGQRKWQLRWSRCFLGGGPPTSNLWAKSRVTLCPMLIFNQPLIQHYVRGLRAVCSAYEKMVGRQNSL